MSCHGGIAETFQIGSICEKEIRRIKGHRGNKSPDCMKSHLLVLVYRKRNSDGSGYNEEVQGQKHQI